MGLIPIIVAMLIFVMVIMISLIATEALDLVFEAVKTRGTMNIYRGLR